MVAPMILPQDNLLAGVDDVFNGIMVRGDSVGDVAFVGRGAGKLPTASAVVADVIDEAKHLSARKYLFWGPAEAGFVENYRGTAYAMLLRFACASPAEAATRLAQVFGEVRSVTVANGAEGQVAVITPALTADELDTKLAQLGDMTLLRSLRFYN